MRCRFFLAILPVVRYNSRKDISPVPIGEAAGCREEEKGMGKGVVRFYDPDGENGYLSNWYRADFRYAGRTYHSVEQYMMLQKALTFGDAEIAEQIEASEDLREIKRLGHIVAHFNESLWKAIRVQILRRGIRAKFQQNPKLLCDLLDTGNTLLAECAPRDLVWGIGIDIEDSRSSDPKEWKGRNLLGRTLMRVREDLRAWCAVAGNAVTVYEEAMDLRSPRPVKPSRRSDSSEAERIRLSLMQSFGDIPASETSSAGEPEAAELRAAAEGLPAGPGAGMPGTAAEERGGESSVWNMRISEAVMLPYVSEIVSTWMEEVLFNLRRSRSYEDLGVSNYTFEELEWMLRSGQSAGLPKAGFFEMKQDIFDLMRYQGGLRNPAGLLAQVDRQEPEEAYEEPAEEEETTDTGAEEHISVAFRPHEAETTIAVNDPGITSPPETYLSYLPDVVTGEQISTGSLEEAKTSIGSTAVDSRPASDLWADMRQLAAETSDGAPAQEMSETPAQDAQSVKSEETAAAEKPNTENVTAGETAPAQEKPAEETAAAETAKPEPAGAPAESAAAKPEEKTKPAPVKTGEASKEASQKKDTPQVKEPAAEKAAAKEPAPATKKTEPGRKDSSAKSAAELSALRRKAAAADLFDDDEDETAETAEVTTAAEAAKETPAPAKADTEAKTAPQKKAAEVKEATDRKTAEAKKTPEKAAEPKETVKAPEEKPAAEPEKQEQPAAAEAVRKEAKRPPVTSDTTYRSEVRSEIVIKHGSIEKMACDAIVNATNNTLLGGPGIDNTILRAGGPELLRECAALRGCDVGRAKISRGDRLRAAFVIHTVGPKYSGDESDPVYLTMCYENCLNLAMKYDLHTIAFPPISTGYFGYPLREAAMIAGRTVQSWMRRHPEYGVKVYFVSADERTFAMYREILSGRK